jgi:hypothetical protein
MKYMKCKILVVDLKMIPELFGYKNVELHSSTLKKACNVADRSKKNICWAFCYRLDVYLSIFLSIYISFYISIYFCTHAHARARA